VTFLLRRRPETFERLLERVLRRPGLALVQRHPPPEVPWTDDYGLRHEAFVAEALDSTELIATFGRRGHLPRGYGLGFDERVVEFPWTLAARPRGRTLDAGSTLNHDHVLDRFLPGLQSLTITTLAPEERSFPEKGVSYVFADLRELPFRDAWFDTVISLSTLEHVGMDNSVFGVPAEPSPEPDRELQRALAELRRVLRPGGRLLATVPYGLREDHGWFRQLDEEQLERMIAAFRPRDRALGVFRYGAHGWQRSNLRAAADARYQDYRLGAGPAEDLATAARAVACVRLTL
jgi:SAM-dependent methyltransferase